MVLSCDFCCDGNGTNPAWCDSQWKALCLNWFMLNISVGFSLIINSEYSWYVMVADILAPIFRHQDISNYHVDSVEIMLLHKTS